MAKEYTADWEAIAKMQREIIYQKKGALQEIYAVTQSLEAPELKLDAIEKIARVSGVFIEQTQS